MRKAPLRGQGCSSGLCQGPVRVPGGPQGSPPPPEALQGHWEAQVCYWWEPVGCLVEAARLNSDPTAGVGFRAVLRRSLWFWKVPWDGASLPTPSDGSGMLSILHTKTSAGPHTSQQAPRRCLSCRNGPGRVRVIWLDTRVLTRLPTGPIHPSPARPTLQRLLITCSAGAERGASALGKPRASAGQPGGSPVSSAGVL